MMYLSTFGRTLIDFLYELTIQEATEVDKAVYGLRRKSEFKYILNNCVELNRLENMADCVYRVAIGELFENTEDITEIFK